MYYVCKKKEDDNKNLATISRCLLELGTANSTRLARLTRLTDFAVITCDIWQFWPFTAFNFHLTALFIVYDMSAIAHKTKLSS